MFFIFKSKERYTNYKKENTLLVEGTSIIHDNWIFENFKISRLINTNTDLNSYIYSDTVSMNKKDTFEISYVTSNIRVFLMCTIDKFTGNVITFEEYLQSTNNNPIQIWYKNSKESDIFKTIIKSINLNEEIIFNENYTNNPFSKSGIYCMLIDLHDPILGLIRTKNTTIITYENIDLNLSRYFIPYHEIVNIDVASIYQTKSVDGRRIKSIAFTYCIWSPKQTNMNIKQTDFVAIEKIGFFTQFFNVSQNLINIAQIYYEKHENNRAIIKPNTQISLIFKENDYMIVKANNKEDLPKEYTWVEIKNNVYDNAYFIETLSKNDNVSVNDKYIEATLTSIPPGYNKVYVKNLELMGDVVNTNNVTFRKNGNIEIDKIMYYDKYSCFDDNSKEFEFQCTNSVWDRKCINNTECPFYDMNRKRGGCEKTGFCEMPLGVKQIGYRYYDKNTKPYCNSCKNKLENPYCCKNNKDDFAFPFDDLYTKLIT